MKKRAMISIQQLESHYPLSGLALWKKDKESVLIDVNQEYAKIFGFKHPKNAIGKTDHDIPCNIAELANYFIKNDKKIIMDLKPAKYLCILQTANAQWKALLVIKSPFFEENKVQGTAAYSIELPNIYLKLAESLAQPNTGSMTKQASYSISTNTYLTPRESECLFFMIRGKSAKQTANIFSISSRTVEQHIESIKYKFKCKTKLELIAYAIENNHLNIIPESLLKQQLLISLE